MGVFWLVWVVLIALLAGLAAWLGSKLRGTVWGIFIDARNTWSLSQFQLVCWTFIGLPLIVATAVWRSTDQASTAWDFTIPGDLLALMGISLGSAVASLAIKSTKDGNRPNEVAAREESLKSHPFADMFAVEEGSSALRNIDITKFQNFIISLSLLASYVWIVIEAFANLPTGESVPSGLPVFSQSMVGLLAISHGGYLIGKIPNRSGDPATPPEEIAEANNTGSPRVDLVGRPVVLSVASLRNPSHDLS